MSGPIWKYVRLHPNGNIAPSDVNMRAEPKLGAYVYGTYGGGIGSTVEELERVGNGTDADPYWIKYYYGGRNVWSAVTSAGFTYFIKISDGGFSWKKLTDDCSQTTTSISYSLDDDEVGYFYFTPTVSGTVTLYTSGAKDSYGGIAKTNKGSSYLDLSSDLSASGDSIVTISNSNNMLSENDDDGGNRQFKCSNISLTANTTYEIFVHNLYISFTPTPTKGVKIYTSDGWKNAIPYIYTSDGWKKAIPYVYKNSTDGWKTSGF